MNMCASPSLCAPSLSLEEVQERCESTEVVLTSLCHGRVPYICIKLPRHVLLQLWKDNSQQIALLFVYLN